MKKTKGQKMKRKLLCSVGFAVLFAACGDETTNVTEVTESTGMDVVAKGDKLPACDKDNVGKMIFVADSAAVYYCVDGEWSTLNGKNGESGTSCTAKEEKDGVKVSCGGDVIGTIKNGTPGEAGDDCSIASDDGGVVKLVCGSGENAKTTTVYKAMCGTKPYEPSTSFCDERDGRIYRYVSVGTQVWMAENLNYAYLQPTADLDSSSFCYDNDQANCEKYGRLYLWSAAMDSVGVLQNDGKGKGCGDGVECAAKAPVQGICPTGWHLPSKVDFEKLLIFVTGEKKEKRNKLAAEEWGGVDVYGFAALPAGYYDSNLEKFNDLSDHASFWPSTEVNNDEAYYLGFVDGYANVGNNGKKGRGRSVRCLQD